MYYTDKYETQVGSLGYDAHNPAEKEDYGE